MVQQEEVNPGQATFGRSGQLESAGAEGALQVSGSCSWVFVKQFLMRLWYTRWRMKIATGVGAVRRTALRSCRGAKHLALSGGAYWPRRTLPTCKESEVGIFGADETAGLIYF